MVSDKGTTRKAGEEGVFEEQRGGRCRAGDSVIRGYERRKRTRETHLHIEWLEIVPQAVFLW